MSILFCNFSVLAQFKMALKQMLILFTFLIKIIIVKSHKGDLQCFLPGECTNSTLLSFQTTTDQYECLDNCKSQANCTWFTFKLETKVCLLFETCGNVDATLCPQCVSGQRECSPPEPICWVQGYCHGNVLHTEDNIRYLSLISYFIYFQSNSHCNITIVSIEFSPLGLIDTNNEYQLHNGDY